jgi:hypothetical protein
MEFKEYSNKLLEEFKQGKNKMMLSNLVGDELIEAMEEIKNKVIQVPFIHTIYTKTPSKAYALAWTYIVEKILREEDHTDALHIATATLQGADILASWNFKHIVNKGKIPVFNKINIERGFRTIKIKTPREILNP